MKSGQKHIYNFLRDPTERTMSELISYSRINDLQDSEIISLANGLVESGDKIDLRNLELVSDIPSTGGPSSLSTLICPLFLRGLGNKVLKLGVPGRPAGGIDILAQIDGYNIAPELHQVKDWIFKKGYVHFVARDSFTPLDALLFNYRKKNNGVDIPALVIASILSKKIAVGINNVGLDIRVSDIGNFGKTWAEARQNGIRFNRIANLIGKSSKCFLTNGNMPQQPYIGRGEAILALSKLFSGEAKIQLSKHIGICFAMASSISTNKKDTISIKSIEKLFFENIELQGGSITSFNQIACETEDSHDYCIKASKDGLLQINLGLIRNSIVQIQNKYSKVFPDPCGIILKAETNEYVSKGDVLCTYRCSNKYKEKFKSALKMSFNISEKVTIQPHFEEISYG